MSETGQFLHLSEATLAGLGITIEDSIAEIEAMFRGHAAGTVWWAPKATIEPPDGRYQMATLSSSDDPNVLVLKVLILNPENSAHGLPQINGLITILDSVTGLPVAVADANWITAIRTAALSATTAKRLARADSKVAGFIGCGVQARSHLDAFAAMYPLSEVRMFGRGQANIDALSETARGHGLSVEVCSDPRDVLAASDILVTSVTYSASMEPFLDVDWMKPGSFAAATDLAAPWKRDSFGLLDRLVIDDLEQEAGMPVKLADPAAVSGDISGLVIGRVEGRRDEQERTAFVFRAHPIGDLALSALAYRKARERGLGVPVAM